MNILTRKWFYLTVILCVGITAEGCSVLTNSQVNEIKRFSQASESYTNLPGALARTYGVLLRDNTILAISRHDFGKMNAKGEIDTAQSKKAWAELQGAYTIESTLDKAGRRMDAALTVLKTYSKILVLLVSDTYTDELGKSAVKLGKALDTDIETYNDTFKVSDPVMKVGGLIGQAVRASGGIYLRHRQSVILRDTLKAADPIIQRLMVEVKNIALTKMKPAFENYEENFLGKEFKSTAINNKRLPATIILFVYEDLRKTREAVMLSEQVANAADTYAAAHRELVDKTRTRHNLRQIIEEVRALKKEVDEAKKVKKNIES